MAESIQIILQEKNKLREKVAEERNDPAPPIFQTPAHIQARIKQDG